MNDKRRQKKNTRSPPPILSHPKERASVGSEPTVEELVDRFNEGFRADYTKRLKTKRVEMTENA